MQIIYLKRLSALAQNIISQIESAVIDSLSKLLLPKPTILLFTINATVKSVALPTYVSLKITNSSII
jgi:hypothetical protein